MEAVRNRVTLRSKTAVCFTGHNDVLCCSTLRDASATSIWLLGKAISLDCQRPMAGDRLFAGSAANGSTSKGSTPHSPLAGDAG